jgi:hypothetical protein
MARAPVLSLLCACALGACAAAPQEHDPFRPGRKKDVDVAAQALVGAALFDDLTFERTDPSNPARTVEADLSQMPLLGFAGQQRLGGEESAELGFEGGLLFGWRSDGSSLVATGGGTAVVSISVRLYTFDLFCGPYGSCMLGERLRLYLGVGPLLLFADSRYDDETSSSTSDGGFGVGGYARTGLEYVLDDGSMLGIGVRGMTADVDFSGPLGDVDFDALQVMLTYTQRF